MYSDTSVLSMLCITEFISSFRPTGSIPFLHFFNSTSKTESFAVYMFVIERGNDVFSKIYAYSFESLTPPKSTTLFKFFPLLISIVVFTKSLINSVPKEYPMMLMNWLGKRLSIKWARYLPESWATPKAGLNGLSSNLSYKVLNLSLNLFFLSSSWWVRKSSILF